MYYGFNVVLCALFTVLQQQLHQQQQKQQKQQQQLQQQQTQKEIEKTEYTFAKDAEEYNQKFKKFKKILFYNTFFGQENFYYGFGNYHFVEGCVETNCYTTANKSLLGKFTSFN